MKPHAFVAMPFGVKRDSQGVKIDFNRVYTELIEPVLDAAYEDGLLLAAMESYVTGYRVVPVSRLSE